MRASTHMRTGCGVAGIAAALVITTGAVALPANLTIDQSQSSITVRLTILGSSATDTSPVTGYYKLDVNRLSGPTQVGLTDFRAALTRNLTLNVNLGLLGRFNSNANNLVVYYEHPGTLFGPVPINANAFTFTGISTLSTGTLVYTATGFVCTQLQSSGQPCASTIDLANQPPSPQTVTGTLTVNNGIALVNGAIDSTQPLDPNNPALGTIRVTGTIVASGPIVCAADFNRDRAVDFFDYLDFVQAFATVGTSADFNHDSVVDFFDYLDFVDAFAAGC